MGLAKIVKYHPDIIDGLPATVAGLPVRSKSANRVILESDDAKVLVRLDYDSNAKSWLLTAYRKEGGALRPADYRQAGPSDRGTVPPAQGNALRPADDGPAGPRGGADNLPPTQGSPNISRSDPTFNEGGSAADGEQALRKPPADPIEEATGAAEAIGDMLDTFRSEGLMTEEDELVLKSVEKAYRRQEARAKAIEAAAACMAAS